MEKPSAIKQFEAGEDLPFPSPKTLESTYMELQRLQSKLKEGFDLPPPEKFAVSGSDSLLAASPSFDSFYRNKIQRKDAELEDEYSQLIDGEIPIRRSGLRKGGSKSMERPGRKSNPLREKYAAWKREFSGSPFLIALPTESQLSHVYSLQYKNTLYDKALRSVWQLCPPALTRTLSLLRGLLDGFSHDTTVLDHIFLEHKQLLRSPAALLAIGEVPLLNFDLDAITGGIPSPASQRWLAQSKLPSSVSLAGVELGGLDPMSMPTRTTGRKETSSRVSFSSLPPYLSDPYSPQLSSEMLSPRDQELAYARRQLSFESSPTSPHVVISATDCANYSLGILANSVTNSVLTRQDSHSVLPSPPNTVSGCSYIAPGSPLISELAISMSNAHITHRLDYLAADLTSISSLLWPSSACPSAYFPPPTTSTRAKPSEQHTSIDPQQANTDFNSFLGLGSAATYAAISAGALSYQLASTQPAAPVSATARIDASTAPLHNAPQSSAPNIFTSCIACKNASVDVLLVQLQHDAICVKSGEDEASYLWKKKWQHLHHSHSDQRLQDPNTIDYETSDDASPVIAVADVISEMTGSQTELPIQPVAIVPDVGRSASPAPVSVTPDHTATSTNTVSSHFAAATTSSGLGTPSAPSPSPSPPVSIQHSAPSTTTAAPPTAAMKRSSSSGIAGSASGSSRPKSTTFGSIMSSVSGNSGSSTTAHATPIPQFIPVSDMNLLHLRHRFSFLRHVIFSLLKGRPVVIHAEARNRPWVEQVVASLTCFVPGHHLSGDSVAQSLQQLETNNNGEYLPRPVFHTKVVPWRDARDVIFESIHGQGLSSASTKSRLKHTKLVISRFLELHIQKMKSYSTVAKQSEPKETVAPTPVAASVVPKTAVAPLPVSSIAQSASGTTSPNSSVPVTPIPNIPTLSVASRQALKLSHLAHVKLIGLDKSCPVPKSVERYVTYWDWEAEELTCVPYERGKLLDAMINPKKQWPDEASYRSHIHFHLSDLATRAWMYYHMSCIGLVVGGITPLTNFQSAVPPTLSSSPSPSSAVFSIPSSYGSVGGGYSPPIDSLRNPLSVSGSPANDWSTGRTPTEPGHFTSQVAAPKVSTRSLTAAPTLTSPRTLGPSSPPHHGSSSTSKTSPIPPLNTDDLGFEPSTGMLKSGHAHSSSTGGLNSSQTITGATTHGFGTPAKLKDSMSLALGPSLSTLTEPSGASLPSPPSGMSSPRSHNQPGSLWSSTATVTSALSGGFATSQAPSASAGFGKAPATASKAPFAKTASSGSIDPHPRVSGISSSSSAQSAPTPADYAFQSHSIQQRTKATYFASLKVLENDAEIIEYLAELIKTQQAQDVRTNAMAFQSYSTLQLNDLVAIALAHDPEMAPPLAPAPVVPGTTSSSAASIKLDFTATKTYKNVLLS